MLDGGTIRVMKGKVIHEGTEILMAYISRRILEPMGARGSAREAGQRRCDQGGDGGGCQQ